MSYSPKANDVATLWEIGIRCRPGWSDAEHLRVEPEVRSLDAFVRKRFARGIPDFTTRRGYLVEGAFERAQVHDIACRLLADGVIESTDVEMLGQAPLPVSTVTVLRKPGVMDPVAASAGAAIAELGYGPAAVRTFRRFEFPDDLPEAMLQLIASKVLANEAIEQVVFGTLRAEHLQPGGDYEFIKITVPIRGLDDAGLERLSKQGQLYLELEEMRAIRGYFDRLGRNPTDVELETLAQTWSEHCSHKTLRGPYQFDGQRSASGLLKDTIMHVTRTLDVDWCVSVFEDNAGIVKFDDDWNVCFKVETHNHPSAIEPYGGANTGIGGVIRDPMGTGLGAKPICNTDVFCFAPPETPHESLPAGVLRPERVLRGVVAGVRDYGNRMGIPTVNGAVCFDERYLGNPLVYCGTVGLIPADKSFGAPEPGDLIVAIGGRTGRDGIHGATFSSGALTSESETVSGGAVQIGDAITEKKLLDVLLVARDQGLYRAITDCGAGGFSSAVGEMGEKIGARVKLERAPLKYAGLSYTEIWISESQERMVLAVPPENWDSLHTLARSEDVEAVVLGAFEATGRLELTYRDEPVCDLPMSFLHDGRPAIVRVGVKTQRDAQTRVIPADAESDPAGVLKAILAAPNVASKEWIIRQYDHEVLGGSIVKPLVGVADDGPSDAAVVQPVLGSTRGIAVSCGINPRYGDLDPYRMAASAIDEAIRNAVAVGGNPDRIALLDNFCWGNTNRPEVFGSLCEAAFACRDIGLAYRTPFISGKDSLHNEFESGDRTIVIPPTLLISALAIVPDITQCVTMDLKEAGNALILVGLTRDEMGGSHFDLVTGATGGIVPAVEPEGGRAIFAAVHRAIRAGHVRACHDLSEGGLAVAIAEMAFAGGLGAEIDLAAAPVIGELSETVRLFAESNSRLLLEIAPESLEEAKTQFDDVPHAEIGRVVAEPTLTINGTDGSALVREPVDELKRIWQETLRFR